MHRYLDLCKLRVVALMLLCALVGMILANKQSINWFVASLGLLGIACCSSAGAAFNHIIDRHIDKKMQRTSNRPLPKQDISVEQATYFATSLGLVGFFILWIWVNHTAALITLLTMLGYGIFYTGVLKRITPQNIVIGGFTGALPPLLGWSCIDPNISAEPWLLVLIIYVWTPPQFWALSIAKIDDYKKSQLPMLPITHGVEYTKLNISFYAWLLVSATLLPVCINMFGWFYLLVVIVLNIRFLIQVNRLKQKNQAAYAVFIDSIWYLMILFLAMIIDHLWIY